MSLTQHLFNGVMYVRAGYLLQGGGEMKKALSMLSRLSEGVRKMFRGRFAQPQDPAQEMDWDVEDPYEESIFKQIRAASETK
jgi:hypothetical protein